MGLFKKVSNLFKKNNKSEETELDQYISELETKEDTIEGALSSNCDQIIDATYLMEDLKAEYELVTSYFADIQKIESLPEANYNELCDVARKIATLEKDRTEFLHSEAKISDEKFKNIQSIEKDIKDIMGKISECENRDNNIKRDIQHLEGEKSSIEYEEEVLEESLKNLKVSTIVIAGITVVTFLGMVAIGIMADTDVNIYCMITLFIATLIAGGIFLYYRSLVEEYKMCQRKYSKAIDILNKVKIKYINNTNTLEYMYEKYKVNSLKELQYQWEQYVIMVDEIKRYQKNTGDLRVYGDEMVKILCNIGVKDPNVWTKQTIAILDKREMVEVKHNLNVRRQKLREQLEYNQKLKDDSREEIDKVLLEYPSMKNYVVGILAPYRIEL